MNDYIRVLERKLKNVDDKICLLFDEIETHDRQWVSDMVVQFLRTFVEHINARVYADDKPNTKVVIGKDNIHIYNSYVRNCGKYPYLKELINSLNKSVSHFVPEKDGAERLMLMYIPNLLKIKHMMKSRFNIDVLHNIKKFPTDMDKSLDDYYVAIAKRLFETDSSNDHMAATRYYALSSRPVIVDDYLFYEITLALARDVNNKVNRVVVFSKEDIMKNYSVQISLINQNIAVNDFEMPVQFLKSWSVSIRPCELNKIGEMCGYNIKISSKSKFYLALMERINFTGKTILDEILASEEEYKKWKKIILIHSVQSMEECLDELRSLLLSKKPGSNIVRYFLSFMRNGVIKEQLSSRSNNLLSNLYLRNECIPFDDMPFATSLYKHNPEYGHLYQCIDHENREHEFLAKKVSDAAYNNNWLYLQCDEDLEYVKGLSNVFNKKLYPSPKQLKRKINFFGNCLYIENSFEETKNIIFQLMEYSKKGWDNYQSDINKWLENNTEIDDENKKHILRNLYIKSRIGLIYGAAGTGKTKLIEYVAKYFSEYNILFLANTNSAVDNLRRRTKDKHEYKTIYSYLERGVSNKYHLIVIDECSMVSNEDIYNILMKKNYNLLLLVGDVYQIESIDFGNWFNFARYFLDSDAVHELSVPYRAKNNINLLEVWDAVRKYDEHMFLKLQNYQFVDELSNDVFVSKEKDEIILCLGYDGIYGINNVNRFLQQKNKEKSVEWGVWTYKVGDPILFIENKRFGNLLYNNLKGNIIGIEKYSNMIKFVLEIEKELYEEDVRGSGIEFLQRTDNGKSIISFYVEKTSERDDDVESYNDVVPFQIAYAVSIHKAQGLEFDSVKIIITKDIEERVTHSVFYTALTRAKKSLKIYVSGETQVALISRFIKNNQGLVQAHKFAGHCGIKVKNKLSS